MKKALIRMLQVLLYCIPFVFLAMNEDASAGTLWFYLIMIIGFTTLCVCSVRAKTPWMVAVGNILSFVSSCIFVCFFQTKKWGWYFKPFTPYQFVIFETMIAFVIQIIITACLVKKYREDGK